MKSQLQTKPERDLRYNILLSGHQMLNYSIGIVAALMVGLFVFGLSCNGKGPEAGFLGMAAYLLLLPLFLALCVMVALKF